MASMMLKWGVKRADEEVSNSFFLNINPDNCILSFPFKDVGGLLLRCLGILWMFYESNGGYKPVGSTGSRNIYANKMQGVECYLDASPMGKPLYERFGWVGVEEKMDEKSRSVPSK